MDERNCGKYRQSEGNYPVAGPKREQRGRMRMWAVMLAVMILPFPSALAQRVPAASTSEKENLLLGEWEKAKEQWGPDNWATAIALSNLARFYREQKAFDDAEIFYKKVLAIAKEMHRENNPLAVALTQELASVYRALNRTDEADRLDKLAVAAPPDLKTADGGDDAQKAYSAKDFARVRVLADGGSASAQKYLGDMYRVGQGVPRTVAEALAWYRKAADQGYPAAQERLGFIYEDALGVPRDYAKAIAWYLKAANLGDSTAQLSLGVMYLNGRGVAKNDAEAIAWFRKAADHGDTSPEDQYNLGMMHLMGYGVAKSDSEALKWYRLAADQGFAPAQYRVGWAYCFGRGVVQDYAEGAKWFRLAADQGYISAQNDLGLAYRNGHGVVQSDSDAVKWYRLAADQGAPLPEVNLGRMYEYGLGVAKDYAQALRLYRLAAEERNYSPAQFLLGAMYEFGRGVANSQDEAVKWYERAAAQGNKDAKESLARLTHPPSSAALDGRSDYLGYWVSDPSDHRSIREILVSERQGKILVNPFGVCASPKFFGRECDWGTAEATATTNGTIIAAWPDQSSDRRLELSLHDDTLTVVNSSHFTGHPKDDVNESCILSRFVDKEPGLPLLPPPALISPSRGEIFDIYPRTTIMRWQPVADAVSYVVEWASSFGTTWSDAAVRRTPNTTYALNFVGASAGRWRVAAINRNGRAGQWSEWWGFKYLR
jgi:TPR repeat protein